MFINFFYKLKEAGVPVTPTSFLTLQKALNQGLINCLDDFYTCARAVLVKTEKYFDLYDQVFSFYFRGISLPDTDGYEIDQMARAMLDEWLKDPKKMAHALDIDPADLETLSQSQLVEYFKKRLNDQTERHDGGSKWIGTGGTSLVGHSGAHAGAMRVGGESRNHSAVKVAAQRRYKDYSARGPLTQAMMGEALKRLRNLVPEGPMDKINVDESIYQTLKNGGEIELVFDRALRDRLKIILLIDNGGWSMDPYISVVQTLFDYAGSQFKEVNTYFFHNTIYECVWADAQRSKKPAMIDGFSRLDPDTRVIFVGDASMAFYELMARDGSITLGEKSGKPSMERLKFMAETFDHCVWLNPVPAIMWGYTQSIHALAGVFPMFELSLDGLEKAVEKLMEN